VIVIALKVFTVQLKMEYAVVRLIKPKVVVIVVKDIIGMGMNVDDYISI
jgi:hypothetical protein